MKQKKQDSFSLAMHGARLFRDDIEEILDQCQNKSVIIKISDSKNIYENLDELSKLRGNNISELEISGKQETSTWNNINILFKKNLIYIFTNGSEEMRSFGFELKDFFKSKIPWHYKVFNPWYLFFVVVITFNFFAFSYNKIEAIYSSTSVWLFGITFAIWLFSIANRYFCYSVILTRKHEYGFFNRNKDKILLAILGIVFGSLLTLFIQWITKPNK